MMQELESHLEPLKLGGLISSWHDGCIAPGEEWEPKIKENLKNARIIILLISIDFIRSGYCYNVELKQAMERHKTGDACVIPVILRSCIWKQVPVSDMFLGDLQALPQDAKPISKWNDRDDAFTNIAEGIFFKIQQLRIERKEPGKQNYSEVEVDKKQQIDNQQTRIEPERVDKLNREKVIKSTRESRSRKSNSSLRKSSGIITATDDNFNKNVLESDILVLVEFWAPWNGSGRMLAPIIAEIAEEYEGIIKVAKVNTDENPQVASQWRIRSIPALMIFKDSHRVDMLVGVPAKTTISNTIEKYL